MKKYILNILVFFIPFLVMGQTKADSNGKSVFYYDNGKKSSEGILINGKPDGYWKTYYENGVLKSEGNRKNFQLDSIWKFYSDSGKLTLEINYAQGKKNGKRISYKQNYTSIEDFKDDKKNGYSLIYDSKNRLLKKIFFENGNEEGYAYEYDSTLTVITLTEYKAGFIIKEDYINRKDPEGRKQGKFKTFHANGRIKEEMLYKNNILFGYYKKYDENGNILSIKKYENGKEIKDVPELMSLDIKKDYYSSGRVKSIGSYKNDVPEGVRREFNEKGEISKSYIFSNGKMIGEGIIDQSGVKQGDWKEFYENGQKKAEGKYTGGKKIGNWVYYFPDGKIEQKGKYLPGDKADGLWVWYFNNGQIEREEEFVSGKEEGFFREYSDSGKLIASGNMLDGAEEGAWIYDFGNYVLKGEYKNGARFGVWKGYFENGKQAFEGKYSDDLPDGEHKFYYHSGMLMRRGFFEMGKKEGNWEYYLEDGTLFNVVKYKESLEMEFNGYKIDPAFDESDFESFQK